MRFNLCRFAALALLPCAATLHAEGFSGSLALATDRVERGISQSTGQGSLTGDLEWSHQRGAYLGLGVSSVDSEQFGGASVQWSPRVGWRGGFASDNAGRWGLGLTGHVYPGADGQRATALPPRAANAVATQAQHTDFATAELNLSLGWNGWGLNLDRALTDYYGIGEDRVQTGPLGQRFVTQVADSTGSWHVGLSYHRDFSDSVSGWVGVGRQIIRNFEALNYTDWLLGGSLRALGLNWSLEASGTNAGGDYWRLRRGGGETRDLAEQRLTARVAWAF